MTSNKILPVALVAALLGGTVGAFVMRPSKSNETAQAVAPAAPQTAVVAGTSTEKPSDPNALIDNELASETKGMSDAEKAAFRDGFVEGIRTARDNNIAPAAAPATRTVTRTAYRPATRTRYVARNSAPSRVYYDYGQRSGRSFWSKHRDKLTVAMGTGAGALIGGLTGGKKGALIGAGVGAGGSALYTYKLRKRSPRY
ncbi:MAG TPA: glycine zipper domain-containing protein [Pyrinomonadaceae bacterium]|jgi:hypothetical protein|nr:glycine zipper domain-containing protein [Pyrinomonadaceae bacterium]